MAYFDLQVNGYAGVDFNGDDLRSADLARACARLQADGVDGILATVISADLDAMVVRLRRLAEYALGDPEVRRVVQGIHIEGPFLNEQPGYVGAHPASAMRRADLDAMKRLVDAAGGLARLVTLAPERDPGFRVTSWLASQGIVVSAGHCDPDRDQLAGAIDAGVSMFTHLGNGCPLALPRHDNIIQRVLSVADRLWIMFIADGVHVPFFALQNYLAVAGIERSIVVTDAISAAGLGAGVHRLGDQQVVVDDRLATWASDRSHLVGSAMTMPQAAANLREALRLADNEIEELTSQNPRTALGLVRSGGAPPPLGS